VGLIMSGAVGELSIESKEYEFTEEQLDKNSTSLYNRLVKRLIGLVVAVILFVLLSPFLLVISIAIIVDSGFPIFYKADRGGYKGKTFKIYKFRTMVKDADKIGGGTTALNDSRITKIGHFLRKTKLDEVPQLINIIKGEMSFVGPRPELLRYTSQYDDVEKYILKVRPGITDFSSIEFINLDEIVGGENADEMYEKYVLKRKNLLRIKYVSTISFAIDCKLFYMTVIRTLQKAIKIIFKVGDRNGKNLAE
jgi:lipopolysaccharide/colanic/teichoic acid biosynthesis glycosyltransferase